MNPLDMSPEDVKHWCQVENDKFKELYMSAKEVEETYRVSMSRQTQLVRANRLIVVSIGNRVYYSRSYAAWWFGAYCAQQQARVSAREAKKGGKPGRPKKDPSHFTYELFGNTYESSESINSIESKWRRYITDQYPAYFDENGKAIGAVILQQPPELQAALKEIMKVFNKLRSDRIK